MINIDKYKGHTPPKWFWYDDGGISSSIRLYHLPYMASDGDDTEEDIAEIHYDENCIADAELIADAPLILEAYIKKCEEFNRIYARYEQLTEHWTDEDWWNVVWNEEGQ